MSLSSLDRLSSPHQFRLFFQQSEVYKLPDCVVFRIPNDLPYARLGITLKAWDSSPKRHAVKRQIREAFRTHIPRGKMMNYDYNVLIPQTKKIIFPYPKILTNTLIAFFSSQP